MCKIKDSLVNDKGFFQEMEIKYFESYEEKEVKTNTFQLTQEQKSLSYLFSNELQNKNDAYQKRLKVYLKKLAKD